jgi:starch phosphorylase
MDPVFKALRVDVERTRARLPAPLQCLADVAWNLAWSWLPDGASLFRDIDAGDWEASGHNARAMVERVEPRRLAELATEPEYVARARAMHARLEAYLGSEPLPAAERVRQRYDGRPVAYFSAEFGVQESLPIYAGGLGILAGDHLKAASDLGLPLVGVGLRYRQGYFHQVLDPSGWQEERYRDTDFGCLPVGLILKADQTPVTVDVPVAGRVVRLQLWGVQVGRVPLLLLDSDRDDNDPTDRWITGHLYGGGRETRLAQEMALGIGGVLALRALGYDPAVFHMNEGHAAFLSLEQIREALAAGASWEQALAATRARTVFTTHTPVPAGHDTFTPGQIGHFMGPYLAGFRAGAGAEVRAEEREVSGTDRPSLLTSPSLATILGLGRKDPASAGEDVNLTTLAMRTSRSVNGVSRLHGAVSRDMFHWLWPDRPAREAPITHVTNGVHLPTWLAPVVRDLLDRYLEAGWERHQQDPAAWAGVDQIPDAELWDAHCRLKQRLVAVARERARRFRAERGETDEYVLAATDLLEPDALTIGFARRVATYKRLGLLLHNPDRALSLISMPGRAVQLVIAGKAHPGDTEAKRLVQYLFRVRHDPRVVRRATFLVDYNMVVGKEMSQGVDIWLNLPRRPQEASGTSGMKAALNGVLNCSILDGWWAEGYNGRNGWAIGGGNDYDDEAKQDAADADSLYETLEEQILPLYYDRDAAGIPRGWVAMMKEALRTLGPVFNTQRMVAEYATEVYAP